LLVCFCPQAIPVEMPFDQIGDAVNAGDLDAGVMIHEELLYYPQLGLCRVEDLGAAWCRLYELPLPVGLNVIRRDLEPATMQRTAAAICTSLRHALAQPRAALEWVGQLGRGPAGGCTERFVAMFANADSVQLAPDVRVALQVLFNQVVDLGLADTVPALDIIEASASEVAACA
jgi:1,4-dihydroxy-6-naphthoate synthase